VHDAYTYTVTGEPLLGGARSADGAILIVRDPRDVAPALANHMRSSLDEAIAFMGNPAAGFCVTNWAAVVGGARRHRRHFVGTFRSTSLWQRACAGGDYR
jgi:hypothetical protein